MDDTISQTASSQPESDTIYATIINLFFGSPLNTVLTVFCGYLIYRLLKSNSDDASSNSEAIKLPPPLNKHNMYLKELRTYDGKGEEGRVCVAILGKVYDVTKGRRFYGPEGPYCTFAGRDATRALANFDVNAVKDEWDDHEGLSPSQMSSVQEWEMQFSERYEYVGKLIPDGQPLENEEEEDESDKAANAENQD